MYEHVDNRFPEYDLDGNKKVTLEEFQKRQYGNVEGTTLEQLSYIYPVSLLYEQMIAVITNVV